VPERATLRAVRLVRSHRHEQLWEELLVAIDRRRDGLEPLEVITPDRGSERAIELFVARRRGLALNLRFRRFEPVAAEWLAARTGSAPADRTRWEALLLAVLFDDAELARPELSAVRGWIEAGPEEGRAARRASLARRTAELFSAYDRSRPGLVSAWIDGAAPPAALVPEGSPLAVHDAWQGALFRRARARGEARTWTELLALAEARPVTEVGAPLHVLLAPTMPETLLRTLAVLARERPVTVYALDPCREFWEDALSGKELARRKAEVSSPNEENPLLAAWGRAGRQTLAALHELADWNTEERFDEGGAEGALAEVQRSIVERRPIAPCPADGTLSRVLAPSLRREVEWVAAEIWQRIAEGARFTEIAVLFPDGARDRYLPLVESVLAEARQVPFASSEIPLVAGSPIAAAAHGLWSAAAGELTRSRLLDLVLSSKVRAHLPDAQPSAWAALLDRLGFFRGLVAEDTEGRGGDLSQALDRMALGAVAPGERSAVSEPLCGLFPEEIDAAGDESGGLYVLVRSLADDLLFARHARLSLTEWSRFFGAMLSAYLHPESARDEAELGRVRTTLAALERRHLEGTRYPALVPLRVLLAELEAERVEFGTPGVSGVTVGTLGGHRGRTAAHLFVLGLGEGQFGGGGGERGLDVSRAARQRLDVEHHERDRYLFLETLLAARQRLTVSWVARDEASGEELSPSPVLAELFEAAGALFASHTPPLRRHEDDARGPFARAALPLALAEARAQALGDRERAELGGDAAGAGLSFSAFARLVRPDDPRRALLAWDAVGEAKRSEPALAPAAPPRRLMLRPAAPAASPDKSSNTGTSPSAERVPVRVRLPALRSFLERPMQAAAEHALGAAEREDRARFDEPPLAIDPEIEARVLSAAVRHALEGHDLARFLTRRVRREEARGRVPPGALGRREEASLLAEASQLLGAVRALVPSGPARPFRLGPGRTVGEVQEVALPPLSLGDVGPGPGALLGESHAWLANEGAAVIVLDPKGAARSGERRAKIRAQRMLLRAFVDHAALAALGNPAGPAQRTVHLVTAGGALTVRLRPFDGEAARRWLRSLASELVRGHAAFLPVEVLLAHRERIARGDPDVVEALERALDKARAKDERLGELHGPVRDPKERPAPERAELLRLVGQRLGPFFDHLIEGSAP